MSSTQEGNQSEFLFHPRNVMLYILLFGLSALFLSLTLGYIYIRVTNGVPPVQVPALFYINTLILLGSSYTMIRSRRKYLDDDTKGYQENLRFTIILSILFGVMQTVAWYSLFQQNIRLQSSTTTAFLYVISFVHLLHVLGGLPFLYQFYKTAKKRMIDPVTVLVYFSDPERRLSLRLLTIYWHFLDLLWLYLIVFFALNYMI